MMNGASAIGVRCRQGGSVNGAGQLGVGGAAGAEARREEWIMPFENEVIDGRMVTEDGIDGVTVLVFVFGHREQSIRIALEDA